MAKTRRGGLKLCYHPSFDRNLESLRRARWPRGMKLMGIKVSRTRVLGDKGAEECEVDFALGQGTTIT